MEIHCSFENKEIDEDGGSVTPGSRTISKVVVNTRAIKTSRRVKIKIWFNTTKERKSAADNGADCDATWPRMAPQTLLGLATKKPKNDKKNCSYICLEIEFSKPK